MLYKKVCTSTYMYARNRYIQYLHVLDNTVYVRINLTHPINNLNYSIYASECLMTHFINLNDVVKNGAICVL